MIEEGEKVTGTMLRRERRVAEVSQSALARELSMSRNTIIDIESGRVLPTDDLIHRWRDAVEHIARERGGGE